MAYTPKRPGATYQVDGRGREVRSEEATKKAPAKKAKKKSVAPSADKPSA